MVMELTNYDLINACGKINDIDFLNIIYEDIQRRYKAKALKGIYEWKKRYLYRLYIKINK